MVFAYLFALNFSALARCYINPPKMVLRLQKKNEKIQAFQLFYELRLDR